MRLWVLTAAMVLLAVGGQQHAYGQAHDNHHEHAPQKSARTALNAEVILGTEGLQEGLRGGVMVRFTHADGDGAFPLFAAELAPVHDYPIHVLAIDPALADYHHEHPVQVEKEGNYAFFIRPRTPCRYKMWAQVHFKGGIEEIVTATIPGKDECKDRRPDRSESWHHAGGQYAFTIDAGEKPLKKGADSTLTLTVTDKDGTPVESLEPLMGAFAHLVGFYEDYQTIAHLHPMGEEPSRHERGGPELQFHYTPERGGLVKLFAQVKIGGRIILAPFTVTVAE